MWMMVGCKDWYIALRKKLGWNDETLHLSAEGKATGKGRKDEGREGEAREGEGAFDAGGNKRSSVIQCSQHISEEACCVFQVQVSQVGVQSSEA